MGYLLNMTALLLLLILAQDQTAEARKLLDGLAPKDPAFSQIEYEVGGKTCVGYFQKGKTWRVDTKKGDIEMIFLWDAKSFVNYMKKSNRFFRLPKDSPAMLLTEGGALGEICFSGNSDRLFAGNKATVKKEKLEGVDCSHITIPRPDQQGSQGLELHLWVDANNTLLRYTRKSMQQGKVYEQVYTYKVIDPLTAAKDVFDFEVPADAKDLRGN